MASSKVQEIMFKGLKFTTVVADSSTLVDSYFNKLGRSLRVQNTNIGKPIAGLKVCYSNPDSANERAATLHLCYESRCILIQLLHLDSIPQSLKTFLANPDICYVGSDINNAVAKLRRDFELECVLTRNVRPFDMTFWLHELSGGCFDMEKLDEVKGEISDILSKMPRRASCDWTGRTLSMDQIKSASVLSYVYYLVGSKLLA